MKKQIIWISVVSVFLFLNFPAVNAARQISTYFVVDVVDEASGSFVEESFLTVIVTVEGRVVSQSQIELTSPNQRIPFPVDVLPRGAVVNISISKQGYEDTPGFSYTISEETPEVGMLFGHTFLLQRTGADLGVPKLDEMEFDILVDNYSYSITVWTDADIKNAWFHEPTGSLVLDIEGKSGLNTFRISIPKSMMNGDFTVFLDGAAVAKIVDEGKETSSFKLYDSGDMNIIEVYSGRDEQQISITSTQVVPELPQTPLIIGIGITVVVIALVIAQKKITNVFQYRD